MTLRWLQNQHSQMLGPRVTLATSLFGALELFVKALATSPALSRGTFRVRRVCMAAISIVISIVYVEIFYILVVRPTAGTTPLMFLFLLDVVRRSGLLKWRHGLLGS